MNNQTISVNARDGSKKAQKLVALAESQGYVLTNAHTGASGDISADDMLAHLKRSRRLQRASRLARVFGWIWRAAFIVLGFAALWVMSSAL